MNRADILFECARRNRESAQTLRAAHFDRRASVWRGFGGNSGQDLHAEHDTLITLAEACEIMAREQPRPAPTVPTIETPIDALGRVRKQSGSALAGLLASLAIAFGLIWFAASHLPPIAVFDADTGQCLRILAGKPGQDCTHMPARYERVIGRPEAAAQLVANTARKLP